MPGRATSNYFLDRMKRDSKMPKRSLDKLEYRIETYKQFVPWPALIESLERDLATLRERQENGKK